MPNPSGRWKVIAYSAMLLPAQCSSCGRGGSSNSELYADPGIFYEWDHVQVYFCQGCVTEAAALFGLGPVYQLRNEYANLDLELVQTRAALERAEQLNDNLISERAARRGLVDVSNGGIFNPTTIENVTIIPSLVIREPELTNDSQSVVEESVNVEGPNDISESSSYDALINNAVDLARTGL